MFPKLESACLKTIQPLDRTFMIFCSEVFNDHGRAVTITDPPWALEERFVTAFWWATARANGQAVIRKKAEGAAHRRVTQNFDPCIFFQKFWGWGKLQNQTRPYFFHGIVFLRKSCGQISISKDIFRNKWKFLWFSSNQQSYHSKDFKIIILISDLYFWNIQLPVLNRKVFYKI